MSLAPIRIQLDVPRELRFGGSALMRLEKETGKSCAEIISLFSSPEEIRKLPLSLIIPMIAAGIEHESPLTTRQVADLIDEHVKGDGLMERLTILLGDTIQAFARDLMPKDSLKKTSRAEKNGGTGKNTKKSDTN